MFDLKEFFQELDVIYRERPREAEAFLRKGLTISSNLHDMGAELAILNELIGYYRVQGPYEEGEKCIRPDSLYGNHRDDESCDNPAECRNC